MKLLIQYDESKNSLNIRKHSISFQTASKAFDDPQAVIIYDEEHSEDEDRYNLIGAVNVHIIFVHIIFVVYAIRNETVRIISARPATKREIERYYRQRGGDRDD